MRGLAVIALLLAALPPAAATGASAPAASSVLVYSTGAGPRAGGGKVFLARAGGGGARQIGVGSTPLLSADGARVAYLQGKTNGWPTALVIRRVGRPGRIRWRLPSRGQLVGWAGPDVLVQSPLGLLARAPSADRWRVVVPASAGLGFAAVSPDGGELALLGGADQHSNLYIVPRAGGTPRQLTTTGDVGGVAWGLQGIAYAGFVSDPGLWLIQPDGSGARLVTTEGDGIVPIAFDADGDRLLAQNPATHNGRLWAVDVTSGAARALTDWVGDLYGQAISQDGGTVYAAIGCGGIPSPYGRLESIPFSGGRPRLLVDGPCRGSWHV